ncbi:MAG: type II toxin-antitoxin system PemK/MazF family toxin [Acidimicrobiales bacterium]
MWWAEFPAGQRHPLLLLSWDAHREWRDGVTVALVTRTVRDLDAEVRLGPHDGMPNYCVVNLDNLATISKGQLDKRVCVLSRGRMDEVEIAVHRALGMPVPCRVGEGDPA